MFLLSCISLLFFFFQFGRAKHVQINRRVYVLSEGKTGICIIQPQIPKYLVHVTWEGNPTTKITGLISLSREESPVQHLFPPFPLCVLSF